MRRKTQLVLVLFFTVPILAGLGVQGAYAGSTPLFIPDAYEIPGDDIKADARDITALIANAGEDPYTETRTFDAATVGGLVDEDWYRFDVSTHDAAAGIYYLFEASSSMSRDVDPVVEIYGPGLAFTPTDGDTLAPGVGVDPVATDGAWLGTLWWRGGQKGSTVAFEPTTGGTYFIRVRPYGDSGVGYDDGAGPYTMRMKVGPFTRLAGADRIETAVAISQERFADGVLAASTGEFNLSTVVVANGYNYPDALSGASLAGICQSPILLTRSGELPEATRDELLRLDPDRIFVLGGTGAIDENVVVEIQDAFTLANPVAVQRVFGKDRIETSVEIAEKMYEVAVTPSGIWPGTTPPGFAFVASSRNFPDALCASGMSAASAAPILLTAGSALDPRVLQCIQDLGITDVAVVGGTGVLSQEVEDGLIAELGANNVLRLAGATRYETAKVFATWAAGLPGGTLSVGTPGNPTALIRSNRHWVGICRGDSFPDALTAAPSCGTYWTFPAMPILLTPSTGTSDWIVNLGGTLQAGEQSFFEEVQAIPSVNAIPERSYIFGGAAAVSDTTFLELDAQR